LAMDVKELSLQLNAPVYTCAGSFSTRLLLIPGGRNRGRMDAWDDFFEGSGLR
jgi:hypothetical protein